MLPPESKKIKKNRFFLKRKTTPSRLNIKRKENWSLRSFWRSWEMSLEIEGRENNALYPKAVIWFLKPNKSWGLFQFRGGFPEAAIGR